MSPSKKLSLNPHLIYQEWKYIFLALNQRPLIPIGDYRCEACGVEYSKYGLYR